MWCLHLAGKQSGFSEQEDISVLGECQREFLKGPGSPTICMFISVFAFFSSFQQMIAPEQISKTMLYPPNLYACTILTYYKKCRLTAAFLFNYLFWISSQKLNTGSKDINIFMTLSIQNIHKVITNKTTEIASKE